MNSIIVLLNIFFFYFLFNSCLTLIIPVLNNAEYYVINQKDKLCIEAGSNIIVNDNSIYGKGKLFSHKCNYSRTDQKWIFKLQDNNQHYSVSSSKVTHGFESNIYANVDGDFVVFWPSLEILDLKENVHLLKDRLTGKCLTSLGLNEMVAEEECDSNNLRQRWRFLLVNNGWYNEY